MEPGVGGSNGSGGVPQQPAAGAGGQSGAAGDSGMNPNSGTEQPSGGCGGTAAPPSGALSLEVDGTPRTYIVSLPADYDPEQAYPVVFAFHGLGGSGELVSNPFYFGIEQKGGTPSIFVYPDGLDAGEGQPGWPNTDGRDVAFFDALLQTLTSQYCIDENRVFSTGHSYGGIMTHTLACERAEVLRAVAPVAGAHFGFAQCPGGAVSALGIHGNPDELVEYEQGVAAIARIREANGCSEITSDVGDGCLAYECDPGYPVIWCEHGNGHDWPDFAAQRIKDFFDGFGQ
jgi:poly(3-hydroxybutyrate) depolymerase